MQTSIFVEINWHTDPKIHIKIQESQNVQNNHEEQEQSWKTYISQFQYLQ